MRIAGYIDHPTMKISILHMNFRYAIKFEIDGMEQTIKIRESASVKTAKDIKSLITSEILEKIENQFNELSRIKIEILKNSIQDDDFEEII